MKKLLVVALVGIGLVGCTSLQVKNIDGFQPETVKQVCIIKNPNVLTNEFEDSLVRSFARYDINAKLYPVNSNPSRCETTMDYKASQSWDFGTYLNHSKLTLKKNGYIVSEAEFRLKGKAGNALNVLGTMDHRVDDLVDVLIGKKAPIQ